MILRVQTTALAVMLLVAVTGCDDEGKNKVDIEGTVTLDGAPVADGDIMFIPNDKQFGAEAGMIKDGKFKFRARTGASSVEIRASREVPGKKGPMGTEPLLESYIPAEYNSKTTLTADPGPGKTTFNFELKSKP